MTPARFIIIAMLTFSVLMGAVLYYTANYAFYDEVAGVSEIEIRGDLVPVRDYVGIDAPTSPLKIRGCFRIDLSDLPAMEPAPEATPLIPPPWFDCFDAGQLSRDLTDGRAVAYAVKDNTPPEEYDRDFAIITYIAVYPDGRAYLWRQRNKV